LTTTTWLNREHENERLRDAIIRLRDVHRADEAAYKERWKSLEEDQRQLAQLKLKFEEEIEAGC
jgi:hypothetical protein